MKYTVRKSIIHIVGGIWWPMGAICSMTKTLSSYDVENCRDEDGQITRESVARWVRLNSGDFSSVKDFWASIEDGDKTVEFDWATEDGEMAYYDSISETV